MKKKLILMLTIVSVILTGCASKYEKFQGGFFSNNQGYSDYQIDDNKFSVSFMANQYTSQQQTMNMALRRASQLTIQNDFQYFTVDSKSDQTRKDTNVSGGGGVWFTSTIINPGVTIHITCYRNNPPSDAIDAGKLLTTFTKQGV